TTRDYAFTLRQLRSPAVRVEIRLSGGVSPPSVIARSLMAKCPESWITCLLPTPRWAHAARRKLNPSLRARAYSRAHSKGTPSAHDGPQRAMTSSGLWDRLRMLVCNQRYAGSAGARDRSPRARAGSSAHEGP